MHPPIRLERGHILVGLRRLETVSVNEGLWCGFSLGNFISTAEKIRLPDDCTIGYIIEALLEVRLTHTHLFHSHLENLQKLPVDTALDQVRPKYCVDERPRH